MQLEEISVDTERAFFTCLHLEEPEDRGMTEARRRWYAKYKDRGYRAQVLTLFDGTVAGKCHSVPVEHSPFVGRDLLAVLCIYVHMYDHHIGDQRHRGYGRRILEQVEQDARRRQFKGVVAWAMDWDEWNPVSFYEHMGYTRVDQEDRVVAVWKPFTAEAQSPSLLRLSTLPSVEPTKISVLVADNMWCSSNGKLVTVREAIKDIRQMVQYTEVSTPHRDRILGLGYLGGVFLDSIPYRPYELMGTSDELREEIIRRYAQKTNPSARMEHT